MIKSNETAPKRPLSQRFIRSLKKHWQYYILLLPALAYFLVFCYGPMYGAQIAFRNFNARGGIAGSPWVVRVDLGERRAVLNTSARWSEEYTASSRSSVRWISATRGLLSL